MEDIRIYDFSFRLLHIEHNIKSVYWTLAYNGIGTFEGTFPLSGELTKVLFENRYLFLTQGNLQAIITGKTADESIKIYGRTPNWILSRRTIEPFKTSEMENENYDVVIKHVLKTGFFDIFDTDFTFKNLASLKTHDEHFWRNVRNPISDVIRDRLEPLSLGHRVVINIREKKWDFEIYEGTKKPLLLSEENRTMKNVFLSEDLQDFYTAGWYKKELKDAGPWNPSDHLPKESPAKFGTYYTITYKNDETVQSRYPAGSYLVCGDSVTGKWTVMSELPEFSEYLPGAEKGIFCWDACLSALSESEAKSELIKHQNPRTVSGDGVSKNIEMPLSLGDTVRVRVQKNSYAETVSKRVVGMEIWFENGNVGEKLKFKEDGNVI